MATCPDGALAIEAKWTEPRYETVAKRLTKKNSKGEDPRPFVEGWLELLQPHATKPLHLDDFADCVYQLVHRAASACGAGKRPHLAYLHFSAPGVRSGASSGQYEKDLAAVHTLLGHPTGFPFFVVDLPIEPTAAFRRIQDLKKGQAATGQQVRAALLADTLFEFGEPQVMRIAASR
jgi:hypothetical protein